MFNLSFDENKNIDQSISENGKNTISEDKNYIISFIEQWISGKQDFVFHTSGSTGEPKPITIYRKQLEYSAKCTLDFLKIKSGSILLCLPPKSIAGSMQIVRALVGQLSLTVLPPSRQLQIKGKSSFALASMVPLQVQNMLQNDPDFFKNINYILIGGAPLLDEIEKQLLAIHSKTYATYGMTETASHIALRKLGTPRYKTLGDIQISTNEMGQLILKGTATLDTHYETNDLVEILTPSEFKWLGRKDFIINSGGIKMQPEQIEKKLNLKGIFMITSTPDPEYGEVITLLASETIQNLEMAFANLTPYEKPKRVVTFHDFVFTETGKINRMKTYLRYQEYLAIT